MSPPISTSMKPGWRRHDIEVGTILVHALGMGCTVFYQVTHRTAKRLFARRIEAKMVNRNVQDQTYDYLPLPEQFISKDELFDGTFLAIKADGELGPVKRLQWWSVWNGKPQHQFSP